MSVNETERAEKEQLSRCCCCDTVVLAPMPGRQIPVHVLNVMNKTILIWIQAACAFDRRLSSSASGDADVKYMLLHVFKYAG